MKQIFSFIERNVHKNKTNKSVIYSYMEWITQDMDGVLKVHLEEIFLTWVFVLVKLLI